MLVCYFQNKNKKKKTHTTTKSVDGVAAFPFDKWSESKCHHEEEDIWLT